MKISESCVASVSSTRFIAIGQLCVAGSRSRPIVVQQLVTDLILWYCMKTMVMEKMISEYIRKDHISYIAFQVGDSVADKIE